MLSPATIRERVFVEIERLRPTVEAALTPDGSNEFSWLECELWVERSRWLVLEQGFARDKVHATGDRVPDQYQEDLQFWSSRHHFVSSWDLVELLAAFIRGDGAERRHGGKCSTFINYAIVQPLVNPAFGSLFWLAVDEDLDRMHAAAPDLGEAVGAMAYDMSWYPESRCEATQVRGAQIEFVKKKLEPDLHSKWLYADEEAWAAHCAELWQANNGANLFPLILETVNFPPA